MISTRTGGTRRGTLTPPLAIGGRRVPLQYWDPDPPTAPAPTAPAPEPTAPAPTAPAPPADAGKIYTEAEVKRKLEGQGKALAAAEAKLSELHAAQVAADEKVKLEQGKFKELHGEAKAKNAELEAKLQQTAAENEAFKGLLEAEVKGQVDGIQDAGLKKKVKDLMEGRSVLDQRQILATFLGVTAKATPGVQPGAPTRPDNAPPDPKALAHNPTALNAAATDMLLKRRALAGS